MWAAWEFLSFYQTAKTWKKELQILHNVKGKFRNGLYYYISNHNYKMEHLTFFTVEAWKDPDALIS
jgi:hypothetical protein